MGAIISKKQINLAMVGMVDQNGHPYSWSAICNGYNEEEMLNCGYPVIPQYLGEQPKKTLAIPNVNVTHIWCDNYEQAKHVAKASLIPNVVKKPEDVIGKVDAVIIPTDKGWEHVNRAKVFMDANVPLFIDKPMCDNIEDLKRFVKWHNEGKRFMSSSSMRYNPGYENLRNSTKEYGKLKYVNVQTPKTWERYGIHALEGIYTIVKPGFLSVTNSGSYKRDIVHLKHKNDIDVIISAIYDMKCFGKLTLAGDNGFTFAETAGSYYSFRNQLEAFIKYLRTGEMPYDFSETIELMKIITAGIISRNENGREVFLDELKV